MSAGQERDGEPVRTRGVLIAFEGGDGAGKSTQIARLTRWLTARGRDFVVTREPGGTDLGQRVRDVLLHGGAVSPRAEALLFAAAVSYTHLDVYKRQLGETRDLDTRLVDAQETRRILDRLYGYEVSPVLWRKVRQGLSAGRVQSVVTRMIVERERERMAFVPAAYWDVEGTFATRGASAAGATEAFDARLNSCLLYTSRCV